MLLSRLLAPLGAPVPIPDVAITGIAYDSRRVQPGGLFVAIPGFHVDGAKFIGDAFARGAAVAVANAVANDLPADLPIVYVPDTRAALAVLAAEWYGNPAEALTTVGVTGTDGKTTTSYLTAALLDKLGSSGLFTTVAYKIGPTWEKNPTRQTTPEALEVQALLRRMSDAGVTHAVLESSSHGLALHKLDGCAFDIGIFTNLSPDHLDFHGTVEAYRAAKGELFRMLATAPAKRVEKTAVINADDPAGAYMAEQARGVRLLRFGCASDADLRLLRAEESADGTTIEVATPWGGLRTRLALPGRFNVYNALAAAGAALACGMPIADVAGALEVARGAPGRMQRVEAGQPFTVIVDYAHTGAALRQVLTALRPIVRGRLIVLFGCAGERGVERRTGMAEAAFAGSDYAILTSEDPRGEDPDAIIDAIARALQSCGAREGERFERVTDRRAAIARAFALARPGDVVLLTGKGHESTIETANGALPWNEAAVAAELLGVARDDGDDAR
jgi:UDP-N-acetylmuramoyl-L-alanyl-D-glutamate--2,6-diaminopimelate ligase